MLLSSNLKIIENIELWKDFLIDLGVNEAPRLLHTLNSDVMSEEFIQICKMSDGKENRGYDLLKILDNNWHLYHNNDDLVKTISGLKFKTSLGDYR